MDATMTSRAAMQVRRTPVNFGNVILKKSDEGFSREDVDRMAFEDDAVARERYADTPAPAGSPPADK
jgi:hypothetical protein